MERVLEPAFHLDNQSASPPVRNGTIIFAIMLVQLGTTIQAPNLVLFGQNANRMVESFICVP